jgi:hypothetical protein
MKQFMVRIITLFFVLQIGMLHPINLPLYQRSLSKNNDITYANNCSLIAFAENIRTAALTSYYRLTHKKADLHKVLDTLKKELADIEAWMLELEDKALNVIKEKYQISNDIWQHYCADMHRIKTVYNKNMTKAHPDVTHDPAIPADIYHIIISLLEENNINPHSINLRMMSQEEADKNTPGLLAQAKGQIGRADQADENLISYKYHPYTISFFPLLTHKSAAEKRACCAHELQHILQHHVLTTITLQIYLKQYCNIEVTDLYQTPEHHALSQIEEAQAEILSALKNPSIAQDLKTFRQTLFYPQHLYEDHFFHLAYIEALWKVHAWLEFFHHDGITTLRNEWVEKIKIKLNKTILL